MECNRSLKYWIIGMAVFLFTGAIFQYFAPESMYSTRYVASMKSYVFHRSDCPYVLDIGEVNLITFISPVEAAEKGFRPCKRCLPELQDMM